LGCDPSWLGIEHQRLPALVRANWAASAISTLVPIENSNQAILMMQSAKNWVGGNAAVELNCTGDCDVAL